MRTWCTRLAILLLPLLASAASRGSPLDFNLGGYDKPTVLEGVGKVRTCTVTYLVENYVANDTYAARMQFTPAPTAVPLGAQMPCPTLVPPLVAETALNECRDHAINQTDCVFADMARGFPDKPDLANTAESASRCLSDQASQIAVACRNSGDSAVCNVGCGEDQAAAVAAARNRCEVTHQQACTITGVLPVAAP
ncbi:MAG: hypothetical protein ABSC95_01730 [Acetobacteraceae bacterium]|jgi:hypothetical protein